VTPIGLLNIILTAFTFILFARVLISWFPDIDRYHPVVRFLYDVTDPVLEPVRDFMRRQGFNTGPIDFSPMIVLLIIIVIQRFLNAA